MRIFNIPTIGKIAEKFPSVARSLELLWYTFLTAVGIQVLAVITALMGALQSDSVIVWKEVLLSFDIRAVALALSVVVQGGIGRWVRERQKK